MRLLAETTSPLDGLASAASVLLIFEACLIIILVAAIMLLFAFGLRWLHAHVLPPLHDALPTIRTALNTTDRTSGRVIDLVAGFYGRRKGVEAGIKSFVAALKPILLTLFTDEQRAQTQTPPSSGKEQTGG